MKNKLSAKYLKYDISSGVVVFLVALPLCLGIALASGAPLFSGIIAGAIGGLVVGFLSGSSTSVSGPAAGLTAIVLSGLTKLGAFETFLLAVMLAGIIQIVLGVLRSGTIANYFPSNVIKGLLAAIGIILILKQIPHAFGYDEVPEDSFSFQEPTGSNTFSTLLNFVNYIDLTATLIAAISLLILIYWEKIKFLKNIKSLPAPLIVVILGIVINEAIRAFYPVGVLGNNHLVNLPIAENFGAFLNQFTLPDFRQLGNADVYIIAFTIAIVASLETLLNLEATDKLDPEKRYSPPNRELIAQGVGNTLSGLIGGIPLTSVIVRSSVNINSGAKSKLSAVFHGVLLIGAVYFVPALLNKIPLASLAAILLVTGYKLAKVSLFSEMYKKGWNQFIPFIATIVGIVMTDLLIGILVGLVVSIMFLLRSNFRYPHYLSNEKYHVDEVVRIELAQQVSFLHKATIMKTLDKLPNDSQVVIDAQFSEYIDHDVIELIKEFQSQNAPTRNIKVSLIGFKDEYQLDDIVQYLSHSTYEMQNRLTPDETIQILKEGNKRFVTNERINRDLKKQVEDTADNQHPMAAILSCIDSRTSAEMIFDLGLGDVFSIRIAGNIANRDILGSLEFACKVAGAKLIVVLGHTNCGAIKAACDSVSMGNITHLLNKIEPAILAEKSVLQNRNSKNLEYVEKVTLLNVEKTKDYIFENSPVLREMIINQDIKIVGAIYDVKTGTVEFEEAYHEIAVK